MFYLFVGEAEGFVGHNRGFYFSGGTIGGGNSLIQAKYSKDGVEQKMLDYFLGLFPSNPATLPLCNRDENRIHHLRQYITEKLGSSEHFEVVCAAIRFKSLWQSNDAQGISKMQNLSCSFLCFTDFLLRSC